MSTVASPASADAALKQEIIQVPRWAELFENIKFRPHNSQRWMGKSNGSYVATSVGDSCGSFIIRKDWTLAQRDNWGGHVAAYHSILTGYDEKAMLEAEDKGLLTKNTVRDLKGIYGSKWPRVTVLRDKTFLLFVEERTHEEVIEYIYTPKYRDKNAIHGITLTDKEDGMFSAVWVDA